jgi:hypothetical protein
MRCAVHAPVDARRLPGTLGSREMKLPFSRKTSTRVQWGPCCFCGKEITESTVDPCSVRVTTAKDKWQVWFCHSQCWCKGKPLTYRRHISSPRLPNNAFQPTHPLRGCSLGPAALGAAERGRWAS